MNCMDFHLLNFFVEFMQFLPQIWNDQDFHNIVDKDHQMQKEANWISIYVEELDMLVCGKIYFLLSVFPSLAQ